MACGRSGHPWPVLLQKPSPCGRPRRLSLAQRGGGGVGKLASQFAGCPGDITALVGQAARWPLGARQGMRSLRHCALLCDAGLRRRSWLGRLAFHGRDGVAGGVEPMDWALGARLPEGQHLVLESTPHLQGRAQCCKAVAAEEPFASDHRAGVAGRLNATFTPSQVNWQTATQTARGRRSCKPGDVSEGVGGMRRAVWCFEAVPRVGVFRVAAIPAQPGPTWRQLFPLKPSVGKTTVWRRHGPGGLAWKT